MKCLNQDITSILIDYLIDTYNFFVDDLQHMSAVRLDAHTEFAKENDMASFLMSAKNGDQVNQAFWKIASYLSGMYVYFVNVPHVYSIF
jgi:hypothetical protein